MPKTVGILLAGGSGSRLSPLTNYISKHLLPVFDKPMIYYSLSVLLLAGVKEVLLITNPENVQNYKKLFGNGSQLGIKILYFIQKKPNGIPEAFNICKESIKNKDIYLILADNIFYGNNFQKILNTKNKKPGCTIFTHSSKNSKSYGVLKLDKNNKPYKIYEKPKKYISDKIVTGLYFYKGDIFSDMPELERDVEPILNLLREVRPTVITLALDPEGSGPDTHYKVLQAIAESLRIFKKESDISKIK